MQIFFDYDNIETDDYNHPLDPDDSTHSKLLTVYCPLDKTNEEIKQYIESIIEKAGIIDELGKDWYDIIQYIRNSKTQRGKYMGENLLLTDENKKLKEKLEKFDKLLVDCGCKNFEELEMHITSLAEGGAMLHMENQQLKEILKKIDEVIDNQYLFDPSLILIKKLKQILVSKK